MSTNPCRQNQRHVTSPTPSYSKPPVPPRGNRVHQARRKLCIDSQAVTQFQACRVSRVVRLQSSEMSTLILTMLLDPHSLSHLCPRNLCHQSAASVCDNSSSIFISIHRPALRRRGRTSRDEQQPGSPNHPFYSVDSSSSFSVSKLAAHCSDNVQQMIIKRNFNRDSENPPTARPSSPPSVYRRPYKKTGQQMTSIHIQVHLHGREAMSLVRAV